MYNTAFPPSINQQPGLIASSTVPSPYPSQSRPKRTESSFVPVNPQKVKKQKNVSSIKVIKENLTTSLPSNIPPHSLSSHSITDTSGQGKPVIDTTHFPTSTMPLPPTTSNLGFISGPHPTHLPLPPPHPMVTQMSTLTNPSTNLPPHPSIGLSKMDRKYPTPPSSSIMTLTREVLSVVPIETVESYLANERRWEHYALEQRSRRTTQLIEEKLRQLEWISETMSQNLNMYGNALGPLPLPHQRLLRHIFSRKPAFPSKAERGEFLVLLPSHKAHLGDHGYQLKDYDFTSDQHHRASREMEELVPIRLEVMDAGEATKLRDCFTYNLHNSSITVEKFVDVLLQDTFGATPPTTLKSMVLQSIEEQLKDFAQFRKPVKEMQQEDLRILIKLNIVVGTVSLVDQFEWDLACERNNPEQFAEVYCKELGLNGEFWYASFFFFNHDNF
ncbi:Snf5- protein 1 [Coelomomyces lativittatus]|nr:Snf5- protein 1 [Coelomomyces lativittatus]